MTTKMFVLRVGESPYFASMDKRECIRVYQKFTREIQNISGIYTIDLEFDFAMLTVMGEFAR